MKKLYNFLLFGLLFANSLHGQFNYSVHFSHGTLLWPENFATARQSAAVESNEIVNGRYVRYIQLKKVMNAAERAAFEATGAEILGYSHFAAYLVALPQHFDIQKVAPFSPRSIVKVEPDWKIARTLREQPFGEWAVRGDYLDINIQLYPYIGIPEGAALCRGAGFTVLKEGTQNGFLQLRIKQDEILQVAAMPYIQYLELVPPPSQKEDTRGRSLHRANLVSSESPLGKQYNGSGVGVLVRDDGQLGPHIDLQGRLTNLALAGPAAGSHGDGVVGIIGGAGNLDPTQKGMAPGTDLYSLDYVNDFQDYTLPLHLNKGVTLTNSSYSDGCNTGYTLATQTVDRQLFEHPTLMHVFSAGNSNGQNCGYGAGTQWGNITGGHKMAKNAIATANLFADATLVTSSSRGPAYDGRLKPDISANGEDQGSTDYNNDYQSFGGTSGAAPGIAGCLAQLTQAYRTIYNTPDAPSALLKVTLLNTANDLGNVGPDFKFGWGHVNAWRALQLLEQNRWLEDEADQNDNNSHSLQIPSGVKEVKVMLYWAEPPAAENNARALINDLDLTVNSPDGTVNLPWKLNPTPVPALLDAPAGKGRDSLNNTEQVLIENPTPGLYTIRVKGTEVPMGPQQYYIVWEFVRDEIKVTYPAGGEGMVPGEVQRIHWDAYGNDGNFTLRYSTDGGNTFPTIANVGGDRRMYDWTVPNTVSGKVHVMVIRGTKRDTSDIPSSIVRVPQNLQVTKVCPDSMWLSWTEIHDTLSYDAYLLGEKFMELKGTVNTNSIGFPIDNAGTEKWVSVRASHPDGTAGRRANAVRWPGLLLNCPQENDLLAQQILSPSLSPVIQCDSVNMTIQVRVQNNAPNTSVNSTISYSVNDGNIVVENLPQLTQGQTLNHTFQTQFPADFNGIARLKAWVTMPGDIANYNDTLRADIPVATIPVDQYFVEEFETPDGIAPAGWAIENPDNSIGWQLSQKEAIVGPDGNFTTAWFIDYFGYEETGELDYIYLPPLDLTNAVNPGLVFDISHVQYSPSYVDGMRVEVFTDCDINGEPDVVWEKFDPELATDDDLSLFFYPTDSSQWRTEKVDLNAYAGQKILVRLVGVNGYSNTLFIDNIGLVQYEAPLPPVAEFILPDTICRLVDTVTYIATSSPDGSTYQWTFGTGAQPSSSATGQGPHERWYVSAGNKTVRLIVSNTAGADTMVQTLTVRNQASASFTFVKDGLTVTFTNSSSNADGYLWNFGDGFTSTEQNPVHTYAMPGNYVVTLTAENQCSSNVNTQSVGVSSTSEVENLLGLRILPNPTSGDFSVEMNSRISGLVQFELYDAAGRLLTVRENRVGQGLHLQRFENLELPRGVYQLTVRAAGKQGVFNIVVQ
jgi:PKD repeat protein